MFIYIPFFLLYFMYDIKYIVYFIDIVATILAYIFYIIPTKKRKIAIYNIALVFPNIQEKRLNEILFKSMKVSGINFINGIFGRCLDKTNHIKTIDFKIPKQFIEDTNKHNVVLVCHHGGIMLDGPTYIGCFFDKKVTIVIKKTYPITSLLYYKKYYKMLFLEKKKGVFKKLLLSKDPVVILACDQRGSDNSQKIIFLNQPCDFHYGPAVLAQRTNRKIWFIEFLYDFETMRQTWKLTSVSELLEENYSVTEVTQKIADIFTESIFKNPENYLWMYKRFH